MHSWLVSVRASVSTLEMPCDSSRSQEHFAQGRDLAEARALPEDAQVHHANVEGFTSEEEWLVQDMPQCIPACFASRKKLVE